MGLKSSAFGLLFYGVNRSLLLISTLSLETKNTVNQCKQGIVSADSYIDTGMNLGSALSVKNVSSLYKLSVSSLRT